MPRSRQSVAQQCSPRMRGWSPVAVRRGGGLALLPAHAGMVLCSSRWGRPWPRAPRASGDGPTSRASPCRRTRCSPRVWGWFRDEPHGKKQPRRAGGRGRRGAGCAGLQFGGPGEGDQSGERVLGDHEDRSVRALGVPHGDYAGGGGVCGGPLDAGATLTAVGGFDPDGGFDRHKMPLRT